MRDQALGPVAAWGEVGLTGEVRSVPMRTIRAEEAARLGITRHIAPNGDGPHRLRDALETAALI